MQKRFCLQLLINILALLSLLRTQKGDLVGFSGLPEDWHHLQDLRPDVFSMLRLDMDSWFGANLAFPGAGDTPCTCETITGAGRHPCTYAGDFEPQSLLLGALPTVHAQSSQVPQQAAVGEIAAVRSEHKVASSTAGIDTASEKTLTSRSKHRELPIGQNQIKHDL